MVWAHNKIKTTCKDDPSGHGSRKEKGRQKKSREDNMTKWTDLKLGEALRNASSSVLDGQRCSPDELCGQRQV